MIFADKLILLRKKSGWSQEELAEQMNVTRQSVSKWEGAQAVPDLEKMLRLSELFGVSTDYLLKDNIEELEGALPTTEVSPLRRVSMEEASAFLEVKAATARPVAYATFVCILSPICLLILGAISEMPGSGLSENAAAGIGMVVLLAMIAAAVAVFISCGSKTSPYEYLEREIFETEYGVTGMVKERKEQLKNAHTRNNIIGTCLCILSVVPLFAGAAVFGEENEYLSALMLSLLLLLVGVGVVFFVRTGIPWGSCQMLLQEGDYTGTKKRRRRVTGPFTIVYWLAVTAVFLAYLFASKGLGSAKNFVIPLIWAVAGVLYPALLTVINVLVKKD